MSDQPHLKTNEIQGLLAKRYPSTEYALMWEVHDSTGSHSRAADAVVMSLWRSRGLELMGFEIKASRSDWIRERDDPAKADLIARYCDRWYVVVGHESIVKDGELPPTWGLLVPRGGKLVEVVKAPKLKPIAIPRDFLAAMLRRNDDRDQWIRKADVEADRRAAADAARLDERAKWERDIAKAKESHVDLKQDVAEFEKASGVKLHTYGAKSMAIGQAVRFVLDGGLSTMRRRLQTMQATAQDIINVIAAGVDAPDGVPTFEAFGPPELRILTQQMADYGAGYCSKAAPDTLPYGMAECYWVWMAYHTPDICEDNGRDPAKVIADWLRRNTHGGGIRDQSGMLS